VSDEARALVDRIARVERLLAQVRAGRDGRDGRDGKDGESIKGDAGPRGRDGNDGRDGADVDAGVVLALIQEAAARAVAALPVPRDGKDGRDVSLEYLEELIAKALADAPPAVAMQVARGERGLRGSRGERGPQGDPGPMGPMPQHEWSGTKLRWETSPGEWGEFVDLRGPRGLSGGGGGSITPAVAEVNSYFPAGW